MRISERSAGPGAAEAEDPTSRTSTKSTDRRSRRTHLARISGALLFVSALFISSTSSPALAEPLVRGASTTFDIGLVGTTGAPDEFFVVFDAAVAADGSSVVVGQFGGADLQVGTGDAALVLEPFPFDETSSLEFQPTAYIARFDAAAQVEWVERFRGAATSVAIDTDGSIGVTGAFEEVATFGATTLTARGAADAFLARYGADGTLDWVVQAGGETAGFLPFGCQSPRDIGYSVSFGAGGELYLGGGVTGTAVFTAASGEEDDEVTINAAAENVNGFVARYTAAGDILQVERIVSTQDSILFGIAAAPGGRVAISGFVRGTGTVGGMDVTAAGGTDAFVALLDAEGDAVWLAQAGGTEPARPESPVCGPGQTTDANWPTDLGLGIDIGDGSVAVAAEVLGTVTFSNPAGESIASAGDPADDHDLAVARYDLDTGELLWVSRASSPNGMLGGAVLATADGGAAVTGALATEASFGPFALTGTGSTTMFVVGFDADGDAVWADALDTSADGFSVGFGLVQTGAGSIFAVGKTTASPEQAIRVLYATASASAAEEAAGSTIALSCMPTPVRVGTEVTCEVSGGDPDIDVLWQAANSQTFAGEGVTLDAAGSGSFGFTVPAAVLGEELTVELVEWLAPLSLGVVDGPAPTAVPAGGGPLPVWPLAALALAGGLVLRRKATSAGPAMEMRG